MAFKKRAAAFALVSALAFSGSTCKTRQTNSNRPGTTGASQKSARWVAQYRSPASLKYSGANLAVFYYTGISVVSPSVVFVCGDVPRTEDERVAVILRTTDGGQHWVETPIVLPRIQIPILNSIHFISPDTGWAVGADSGGDGIVIRTMDGGASFQNLTSWENKIADQET